MAQGLTGTLSLQPPLTNLKVWLKTPIAGLNHNDVVVTWPDSSGNANDATSVSSPIYKSTSDTINGKPTVSNVAAATGYFTIAVDASAWTAGTAAIVLDAAADPPGGGGYGLWTISDADFNAHYPFTDGIIYDNAFTTVRKTVGNPTPALTDPHHYVAISEASNWKSYLDGTLLFSTTTNTFDGRNGFVILRSSTGTAVDLVCLCAEVLIWDRVLNAKELTTLFGYLDSRFAL